MDKRVIFAVAGSGKTTLLIRRLSEDRRTLLLTFTVNNEAHLRAQIIRRFGFIPEGIRVMTGLSFCTVLLPAFPAGAAGIAWPELRPAPTQNTAHECPALSGSRRTAVSPEARTFTDSLGLLPDIRIRLARYYDELLVDEVEDFAGHDFNFLLELCRAEITVLCCGDFYQHTFDTSHDGNVNSTLHDDITRYEARFDAAGFAVDRDTLNRTWRCSASVCEFITGQLNIRIAAHGIHASLIETIADTERSATLHADNTVIKLFYREHHRYGCYSMNWGASKGLDHFQDVCIVMGSSHWKLLTRQELATLPPSSRNRLYVACSRARGNIYFVPETHLRRFRN